MIPFIAIVAVIAVCLIILYANIKGIQQNNLQKTLRNECPPSYESAIARITKFHTFVIPTQKVYDDWSVLPKELRNEVGELLRGHWGKLLLTLRDKYQLADWGAWSEILTEGAYRLAQNQEFDLLNRVNQHNSRIKNEAARAAQIASSIKSQLSTKPIKIVPWNLNYQQPEPKKKKSKPHWRSISDDWEPT